MTNINVTFWWKELLSDIWASDCDWLGQDKKPLGNIFRFICRNGYNLVEKINLTGLLRSYATVCNDSLKTLNSPFSKGISTWEAILHTINNTYEYTDS